MISVCERFFKSFNSPKQFRFFLWHLLLAFGIIFMSKPSLAAEKSLYNAHGKRDPFIPLVTSTMKSSSSNLLGVDNIEDVVVEGVVYDARKGSIVIVNGTILREGEELGSVKVLKVQPNGARFLVNGVEGFREIYQEDSVNRKNVKKT